MRCGHEDLFCHQHSKIVAAVGHLHHDVTNVNGHCCKLSSRFRHENMVTMGRCTTGTQGIRSTRTAFARNLLTSALALSPENDQHISSYSAVDTSTVSSKCLKLIQDYLI